MRQKMHDGHPNRSELFDLKHDSGGMVDIEFMVQYLVLAHGHWYAPLLDNRGNIELLRRAGQAGLMSEAEARTVGDTYAAVVFLLQHHLAETNKTVAAKEIW